jgi:hypothetical protein
MRIKTPKKPKKNLSLFTFFSAIILAAAYLSVGYPASAACSYPAQVLDLANWKQTLPTGSSSSPTEITQTKLATFSVSPYFQANAVCSGVTFRAPVNGVTTSGSGYPRSELREMTNGGASNASWATNSGAHSMFIDQAITAVPKTKKHVVAGQVHNSSDDVIVIRLEYPKLFVDINGKTGPTLDANYVLGKRFTVQFIAASGQIKIYYNGNSTPVYTLSKSGSGNYFKAGAYTQSNCSKETDCSSSNFGEVVIYNLQVKHQASSSGIAVASSSTITTAPTTATIANDAATTTTTAAASAPSASGLSFEAESGVITAPMQIASSTDASDEKYIVQTTDTGTGSVKYAIAIPSTDQYQLRVRAIAPNGSSNSFYYALDSNSSSTWSLADTLTNWTWVDGPKVSLSQGIHTLTIIKREKGTKLDAFEFRPLSVSVPVPDGATDGTKPFEAETGSTSGGMQILADDATASGGKYAQASSSGQVSYNVFVPVSGTYRLAGWIKAANGSSDSFYASVDGKSSVTWSLSYPTNDWTYDRDDSNTLTLSAGAHNLILKYREAGAKIDKLILMKQ